MKAIISIREKGGAGSGHRGHAGRPGKVGGSIPGKGGGFASGTPPGKKEVGQVRASRHLNDGLPTTWDKMDIDQQNKVREQVILDLTEESELDEGGVESAVLTWYLTYNDGDPNALRLQKASSEEFGVKFSNWQNDKWDSMAESFAWAMKPDSDERSFMRTMYDSTQRSLKDAGFSSGDKITLFRGFLSEADYGVGEVVDYFGNANESWSLSRDIARNFSTNKAGASGFVMSMDVPIENILSTAKTGFGSIMPAEFVIFGSVPDSQVKIVD